MNRLRTLFFGIILFLAPLFSSALTLDLKMAVDTGLKNNQELKAAQEKLKAAESGKAVARSAFFPAIEAKATYTYMGVVPEADMSAMGYTPLPTSTDPYRHTHTFETYTIQMARQNNYDASISLTQPIFMWGRLCNSYELARIGLEMERENYKKTRIKVIGDIKNAFYSFLLAKERAKLTEENYNLLKEVVKSSEANYKSGLITKYDLMAITIKLANLEPLVLQAKDSVLLAKEALRNTIHFGTGDFEVQGEFTYTRASYDLNKLQAEALENNPDLKSAEAAKKSMETALSLSRAANKPSLVGILNYKYSYIPADSQTFGGNNPDSWTAVLALTIPVSEWLPWGRTMNDIDRSKANVSQMEAVYTQLKDLVLFQVQQTFLSLETQYQLIESQKKNTENARDTYAFRQKQYKDGLIRYTELIDAQVALTDAETNYLDAILKYILARVNLNKLLGREDTEGI